jgi:RNA polymerase sigma-54 factor
MNLALSLEATFRLDQRVSPEMIAYAELLTLPMDELESVIERELERNPALERIETRVCPLCGISGPRCLCRPRSRGAVRTDADALATTVAEAISPTDALLADLRPLVRSTDLPILADLLGSLDGRGYLDTTIEETAARLRVRTDRVRTVLALIQTHGPAGIGAADLRGCLLLQLDRREPEPARPQGVRAIVADHLDHLAAGAWRSIATALGITREEVAAAAAYIRTELSPYPMTDAAAPAAPAIPDVVIRESMAGTFTVELVEPERFGLTIAPIFTAEGLGALAPEDRRRVDAARTSARSFLTRLERRWKTIRAVAEVVIARQHAFLTGGPRFLRRLTRAEIAAAVGVHESTVSRATRGRYVLLPDGRIAPFELFFETSAGPRAVLAELIAQETAPLSDGALAGAMGEIGIPLARRTVAKYRERLGIPRHTER